MIRAYLQQRLHPVLHGPLALLVAAGAVAAGEPVSALAWLRAVLVSAALIVQFRLWDDVKTVEHPQGRELHPDWVLSGVPSLAPFTAIRLALIGVIVVLLALAPGDAPGALAVFLPMAGYLGLLVLGQRWYRVLRDRVRSPLAAAHLRLLAYPAFVLLLMTGEPSSPFLAVLALIYLCASLHALIDDERLRAEPGGRALLGVELVALVLVALRLCIGTDVRGLAVPRWLGLAVIAATALLLNRRLRLGGALGVVRLGPFAGALLVVLGLVGLYHPAPPPRPPPPPGFSTPLAAPATAEQPTPPPLKQWK